MAHATTAAADPKLELLLVDDDALILESVSYMLRPDYSVRTAETRPEANTLVRQMEQPPALALVDLGLPPYPHRPDEGFALIAELLSLNPRMRILALSGQEGDANVRHAFALGAGDFIAKPCEPDLLRARLRHQLMLLEADATAPRNRTATGLLGGSAAMKALHQQVEQFAEAPFPVMIQGESGTGKELVARQLHDNSERRDHPFVAVNCAAFTETLLEAQLFGHAKGAFTGAQTARAGFFEEAGDGTLFLDEIGEMPMELQSRLLRVIESGEYYRLGETRPRQSAARLITATNKELNQEVESGRFRQDLFYRLSILPIQVPPLREREGDALMLLEFFQEFYTGTVPPFSLSAEAREHFAHYHFPGNVRELRNIVIRLGTRYPGQTVSVQALEHELAPLDPDQARHRAASTATTKAGNLPTREGARARLERGDFDLDHYLQAVERVFIDAAQEISDGNLSHAAKLLGVNRTTLYSKIDRLRDRNP